jgi:hypothetical protein
VCPIHPSTRLTSLPFPRVSPLAGHPPVRRRPAAHEQGRPPHGGVQGRGARPHALLPRPQDRRGDLVEGGRWGEGAWQGCWTLGVALPFIATRAKTHACRAAFARAGFPDGYHLPPLCRRGRGCVHEMRAAAVARFRRCGAELKFPALSISSLTRFLIVPPPVLPRPPCGDCPCRVGNLQPVGRTHERVPQLCGL